MLFFSLIAVPSLVPPPPVLLLDGGSKRAGATLSLRSAAAQLSQQLGGRDVRPVSVRWSDEVPAEELDGVPARTLAVELTSLATAGTQRAVVAPLFLGPSDAINNGLEACIDALTADGLAMDIHLAECLVASQQPDDHRVARALAALVLRLARTRRLEGPLKVRDAAPWLPAFVDLQLIELHPPCPQVVLVDHGTPSVRVNDVRCRLEHELRTLLGDRAAVVAAASMERRPDPRYDFNEPLLESLLGTPPFDSGDVIVAMAFLSPGRHAGAGGDIDAILADARAGHPALRTHTTPLLASQSLVSRVLGDRVAAAEALEPRYSSVL